MKMIILLSSMLSIIGYAQDVNLKCFSKSSRIDSIIDIELDVGVNFIKVMKEGELVFENNMPYVLSQDYHYEVGLVVKTIEFTIYPEKRKVQVQVYEGHLVGLSYENERYFCTQRHFL